MKWAGREVTITWAGMAGGYHGIIQRLIKDEEIQGCWRPCWEHLKGIYIIEIDRLLLQDFFCFFTLKATLGAPNRSCGRCSAAVHWLLWLRLFLDSYGVMLEKRQGSIQSKVSKHDKDETFCSFSFQERLWGLGATATFGTSIHRSAPGTCISAWRLASCTLWCSTLTGLTTPFWRSVLQCMGFLSRVKTHWFRQRKHRKKMQ